MERRITYRLMVWFGNVADLPTPVYATTDQGEVWAFEEGVVWQLA